MNGDDGGRGGFVERCGQTFSVWWVLNDARRMLQDAVVLASHYENINGSGRHSLAVSFVALTMDSFITVKSSEDQNV